MRGTVGDMARDRAKYKYAFVSYRPEHYAQIERVAKAAGMTVSGWIRYVSLEVGRKQAVALAAAEEILGGDDGRSVA